MEASASRPLPPAQARRTLLVRRLRILWDLVILQALLITRYPVSFVSSLMVSFGGVLALALALKMFAPQGAALRPAAILFYGYLLYVFLSDSLWRIGHAIWEDQVQGTLESVYLTRAPRFAILAARAVPLLALTTTGAALACLAAVLLFGRLPAANLGLAALLFACSVSGTFGLGFLFASYTLLAGETASSTGNFLEFALLFACAMFFPFRVLPGAALWISRAIPFSYCVDAFRSALLGFPAGFPELASLPVELAVAAAYAVITPLLGFILFRRTLDHMRRTGRLGQGG